ncbi:dockerin type I domain-containing protein [Paenibacillus terrigena]|uniref:dockerin type I domain-containing protein n=1 Tax=Paenibacillus terrigena TaxID=369333 RepID=UPI00036A4A0B|nr:dockerin type I domain-containing protein [Paenibacillus terrigena]
MVPLSQYKIWGANVTWDVNASSYDPALTIAQTFTVNGTVTLPLGVANPNSIALTTRINVTVNAAAASLNTVITGSDKTDASASFNLIYGSQHVNSTNYAIDLTLKYDPTKVELVSADSLKDVTKIVQKHVDQAGQVRLLVAGLGEGNGVMADGDGAEIHLQDVSHSIQIVATKKEELNALISTAQLVHDSAVEGTKPNQYPVGSKAVLQAAINKAKAVANNAEASAEEINQAYVELSAALQAFKDSVISRMMEDINGDSTVSIGDLAIVARYYGKTAVDPNWDTIKITDLNGDGIIDIVDLSMVARKILNIK